MEGRRYHTFGNTKIFACPSMTIISWWFPSSCSLTPHEWFGPTSTFWEAGTRSSSLNIWPSVTYKSPLPILPLVDCVRLLFFVWLSSSSSSFLKPWLSFIHDAGTQMKMISCGLARRYFSQDIWQEGPPEAPPVCGGEHAEESSANFNLTPDPDW